jgi:hypothetical protein
MNNSNNTNNTNNTIITNNINKSNKNKFDLKLLVKIEPSNLIVNNHYIICGYPENKKDWIFSDFVIGTFVENNKNKSIFKNITNVRKNILKGYNNEGITRMYFYEYDKEKDKFSITI